jgi:hypothetical protein
MSPSEGASAVVAAWVKLYTSGLAPEVRDRRRAEVVSDLWEHRHWDARSGTGEWSCGARLLTRLVAGLAADASWRLSKSMAARFPAEVALAVGPGASWHGRTATVYVLLLMAGSFALVPYTMIAFGDAVGASSVGLAGIGALVLFAGLHSASAARATILMVTGAVPLALAWSWLVVPSLLVIAVVVYGLVQVRHRRR